MSKFFTRGSDGNPHPRHGFRAQSGSLNEVETVLNVHAYFRRHDVKNYRRVNGVIAERSKTKFKYHSLEHFIETSFEAIPSASPVRVDGVTGRLRAAKQHPLSVNRGVS
jgi:hypothetical protein